MLLFPIISASDDAQAQQEFMGGPVAAAIEDGSAKHFTPACHLLASSSFAAMERAQAPEETIFGWTSPLAAQPTMAGFATGNSGRAPPAVLS